MSYSYKIYVSEISERAILKYKLFIPEQIKLHTITLVFLYAVNV